MAGRIPTTIFSIDSGVDDACVSLAHDSIEKAQLEKFSRR
jgi:hypothetical protein